MNKLIEHLQNSESFKIANNSFEINSTKNNQAVSPMKKTKIGTFTIKRIMGTEIWIKRINPFIIFFIILFFCVSTWIINGPQLNTYLNLLHFSVSAAYLYFAFKVGFSDPGIVHHNKKFKNSILKKSDSSKIDQFDVEDLLNKKYCAECKVNISEKTKHCSICGFCIEELDHHCVVFDICIGKKNIKYFYAFLLWNFIGFFGLIYEFYLIYIDDFDKLKEVMGLFLEMMLKPSKTN